jgi:hypothetical protein
MIAKRVHVHIYEKEDGSTVFSDMPMVPLLVSYDAPAELLARTNDTPDREWDLAKTHVARFNGEPKTHVEYTLEKICAKGGTVNPTWVPEEFQPHAKALFGLLQGMKRAQTIWVTPEIHIPEYFIDPTAESTWKQLSTMGVVVRNGKNQLAFKWAVQLDDAFTKSWKQAGLPFQVDPHARHVASGRFDPKQHSLHYSTTRCVDTWVERLTLPVSMTSVFAQTVGGIPLPPPPPPLLTFTLEELRAEVFLKDKQDPTVMVVSQAGKLSIHPYGNHIQMRVCNPFVDFHMDEIFWVGSSLDSSKTVAQVWHHKVEQIHRIPLKTLYGSSVPYRSCTYERFAKETLEVDVIVLIHPVPHARYFGEALARCSKQVLHVKVNYDARGRRT